MKTRNAKQLVLTLVGVMIGFFLMVSCAKTSSKEAAAEATSDQGQQKEQIKSVPETQNAFELVSIERVYSQQSNSAGNQTAYWDKDQAECGVLITLKLKSPESIVYYSSDFSLGYEDEAGIPRSACMGISMGVMSPDQIKQSTWMLAGAMSRSWADEEKPYFGILFSAPAKVDRFTLFYAAPLLKDIDLTVTGK